MILGVSLAGRADAQNIRISFDEIDAYQSPVSTFEVGGYFLDRNIWGIGMTPGTQSAIINYVGSGGIPRIVPPSVFNYCTIPVNESGGTEISMIFVLTAPLARFDFTRCGLRGTPAQHVVHPAWTAWALDRDLNVLDSASEPAIAATGVVASATFSLSGAGIMRVMFTSDGQGVSTVPALVMDDLEQWVCCNADFDSDGDVGTDADIAAFFACLAGDCCGTCGPPDFDCDGDPGTAADIEAFFRVLAGGGCS